jgi:hypothetical protein
LLKSKELIMKKKHVKNLKLHKKVVSKINELNKTVGGNDSFGPEQCMEEFTLGCSPSFLRQCPPTKDTDPQYCW